MLGTSSVGEEKGLLRKGFAKERSLKFRMKDWMSEYSKLYIKHSLLLPVSTACEVTTLQWGRSVHVHYMSSSVHLSSVMLVRPTQLIEIFRSVSMPYGMLAICWHTGKILERSSWVTPLSGELNTRGVAEYSDFGPIKCYISETVQGRS